MRTARRHYYNKLLIDNKRSTKNYWKILKEIIGNSTEDNYPSYFTNEDGSRDEDEFTVASNFNNFFINIGPKLASAIPNSQQLSSFLK